MEFFPAPFRAPLRAFAVLTFVWMDDKLLVCDIVDRGWCIPSGRVEPNESSYAAAAREALEEGGVTLDKLLYLGCYRISDRNEVRWADVFVGSPKDIVEITCPTESKGREFARLEELPGFYHLWSPLTEAVCRFSQETLKRHQMIDRS